MGRIEDRIKRALNSWRPGSKRKLKLYTENGQLKVYERNDFGARFERLI